MSSDRLTHLKIKIVNLADEARTIRAEEKKALKAHRREHAVQIERPVRVQGGKPTRSELVWRLPTDHSSCRPYVALHDHRTTVVRDAARENLLAYGFLRHVPYEAMERVIHAEDKRRWPDLDEVGKNVRRFADEFGPDGPTFLRWVAWRDAALAHCEAQQKERKKAA